jgi:dihydrodipicolinate synthase/N-acetylneuraminate lyase
MTAKRTNVSPSAMTAFARAFQAGDLAGRREYGDVLTTATDIDAFEYAMSEIADTAKYLTLLQLRYQQALAENARLKAEVERLRGARPCSE